MVSLLRPPQPPTTSCDSLDTIGAMCGFPHFVFAVRDTAQNGTGFAACAAVTVVDTEHGVVGKLKAMGGRVRRLFWDGKIAGFVGQRRPRVESEEASGQDLATAARR